MGKPIVGKVRLNLFMQAKLYIELCHIAETDDRSMADVIREACRDYVVRYKRRGTHKYFNQGVSDERSDERGRDNDS